MLILPLLTSAVLAASPSPCFHPEDQTAGWKAVEIPDDAPALAAPKDVQQFRGGETSLLWDSDPHAYHHAVDVGAGRQAYVFSLPAGTQRAVIGFADELRGAKVDALLRVNGRVLPLADERRVGGRSLELEWSYPEGTSLELVIHHHLRRKGIPVSWRFGRIVDVASAADTPEPFRRKKVLYFLHPGGRKIALCHAPGQALSAERTDLKGEVTQLPPVRR